MSDDERNVVVRWLREYGHAPQDMLNQIFDESQTGFSREACLRLWLALEAGRDPWGKDIQSLRDLSLEVHRQRGIAPPTFGKFKLFDRAHRRRFRPAGYRG